LSTYAWTDTGQTNTRKLRNSGEFIFKFSIYHQHTTDCTTHSIIKQQQYNKNNVLFLCYLHITAYVNSLSDISKGQSELLGMNTFKFVKLPMFHTFLINNGNAGPFLVPARRRIDTIRLRETHHRHLWMLFPKGISSFRSTSVHITLGVFLAIMRYIH